jgi:hypothetical protein
MIERRKYIRHKLDIPIQIEMEDIALDWDEYLKDISAGGLCFKSKIPIGKGTKIHIKIPLLKPVFEAEGLVVWCRKVKEHFEVGLDFIQEIDVFRMRMVEQACHIEQYKEEIYKKEGRLLTGTQAALEWIEKFAEKFPKKMTTD